MARARNLKPGFFKDAKVVSCSFPARLLFQGMWCVADYMGRLKYVPLELKMEIFPADDVDIDSLTQELADQGLIQIYRDHSASTLVQVTNFSLHQNPHQNERFGKDKKPAPCLPGPEDFAPTESSDKNDIEQMVTDALKVLREYSETDPADSLNLIPSYINPSTSSQAPTQQPSKTKSPKWTPEHMALARHMADTLSAVGVKVPNLLNSWADTIRLACEQDNRTLDDLRAVFDWSRNDDFWCAQILSAKSLRSKFDQLNQKRLRGRPNGSHQPSYQPRKLTPAERTEQARQAAYRRDLAGQSPDLGAMEAHGGNVRPLLGQSAGGHSQ